MHGKNLHVSPYDVEVKNLWSSTPTLHKTLMPCRIINSTEKFFLVKFDEGHPVVLILTNKI